MSSPGPSPYTVAARDWWAWKKAVQLPFDTPKLEPATVQVQAMIQSPSPGPATGNSTTWPTYRTAPLELALHPPQAAQRLRAHVDANQQQFSVGVDAANGAPVDGALLVAWMLAYGGAKTLGRLRTQVGSTWSGTWAPQMLANNAPINVQVWVAGPGYVTALAQAEVPSGLDGSSP